MSEFKPVTTVAELATLDLDEVIAGYRDGFAGEPEPGNNRTKSFWHGWRNGYHDRTGENDGASRALAHDYLIQRRKSA